MAIYTLLNTSLTDIFSNLTALATENKNDQMEQCKTKKFLHSKETCKMKAILPNGKITCPQDVTNG